MKLKNYYKEIVNYYDSSQILYRLFCYNTNSLGMHFGYWYKDTKDRYEAMLNTNQDVINLAKIKKGQKVLDAGCGVGGTAIYIAKKTGANVVGITLSQNQVDLAKYYAKKHGVESLIDFRVQDYTKTNFPNSYFDVVYGIESIGYAYSKENFLKEAFRILKPGGKLVVIDGYTINEVTSKEDKKRLDEFNKAFAIKEILSVRQFSSLIKKAGFRGLKLINRTKEALPSGKYYYDVGKRYAWLIKILSLLPFSSAKALNRNILALKLFYEFLKSGFGGHFIHYVQKP